jgi:hypothetical protein
VQAKYKDQLPISVQALADQIETFAGLPIAVRIDSRPVSPMDPNPDRLALDANAMGATVLLRSEDFSPHGFCHELLHLERFWVQAIPQVVPLETAPASNWQVTSQIENCLEHQIIVPREADYDFEPYDYWAETERKLWGRYPWPDIKEPDARRRACLLGGLSTFRLVRDEGVIQHVTECLDAEGMLKETAEFVRRVSDVVHTKEKMLRLTLQHLGISRNEVKLIRLDVRSRQTVQLPF